MVIRRKPPILCWTCCGCLIRGQPLNFAHRRTQEINASSRCIWGFRLTCDLKPAYSSGWAATTSSFRHQNIPLTWSNSWIHCTVFVFVSDTKFHTNTLQIHSMNESMYNGKYQQSEWTLDKPWTTCAVKGLVNLFVRVRVNPLNLSFFIYSISSTIHLLENKIR